MIDFHTHVLPNMDDGARDASISCRMLLEGYSQGVEVFVASSHFYPDKDEPDSYLKRRSQAIVELKKERMNSYDATVKFPKIIPAAEVYYFPGISDCEEIIKLAFGKHKCLLVEPPMVEWYDSMLDDIEQIGKNFSVVPVIAHVDRYMRMLKDWSLVDRVNRRRLLVQVNASFFIHEDSRKMALEMLDSDRLHLVGTDCHDLFARTPNLGAAREVAEKAGLGYKFERFGEVARCLLI